MSAYLCNPEHIGLLAALACGLQDQNSVIYAYRLPHALRERVDQLPEQAARVAFALWRENVRSVECRYPGERNLPGPRLSLDDQALAVQAYARHYAAWDMWTQITPIDVLSLCHGYAYQAGECEDWRTTDAELQMDWLKRKAIRRLPGADDAPWGYTEAEPLASVDALYEKHGTDE